APRSPVTHAHGGRSTRTSAVSRPRTRSRSAKQPHTGSRRARHGPRGRPRPWRGSSWTTRQAPRPTAMCSPTRSVGTRTPGRRPKRKTSRRCSDTPPGSRTGRHTLLCTGPFAWRDEGRLQPQRLAAAAAGSPLEREADVVTHLVPVALATLRRRRPRPLQLRLDVAEA